MGTVSDLMEKNNWDEQHVLDWIDQKAKQMTQEAKEKSGAVIIKLSKSKRIAKDQIRSLRVGYLFLRSLYSSLGIPKILDEISE